MAKLQEERFDAIAKGQVAKFLQSQLADILIDREDVILNGLINSFNSNRLTNERMLAGIAAIAELRKLMGELDKSATKGMNAAEIELGNSPGPNGYSKE